MESWPALAKLGVETPCHQEVSAAIQIVGVCLRNIQPTALWHVATSIGLGPRAGAANAENVFGVQTKRRTVLAGSPPKSFFPAVCVWAFANGWRQMVERYLWGSWMHYL